MSEFLPVGAADAASPGSKRAAPDTATYNSSSSEDETAAADTAADAAAAAAAPVERRKPQVIFCSRTHSQLSQFVGELHRTRFGGSVLLVAVASRKALCVNDEVSMHVEFTSSCFSLNTAKVVTSSCWSGVQWSTEQHGRAGTCTSIVGQLRAVLPRHGILCAWWCHTLV